MIGYNPDYDYLFDPQQDPPGTRIYEKEEAEEEEGDDACD